MSSSNIQQAGDCVDSSGLLFVNYCPAQFEVQLEGQDSFKEMEGSKRMIWVGKWGGEQRREKKWGEREEEREYNMNNIITVIC